MRVAIVGAGVIGASAAYHLAAAGVDDVVILERGRAAGEGSTGRATGGFRAQFASAINVRLSLLAREKLRRFREEVGGEAGYDPRGYLFLGGTEADLARLRAARAVQAAEGLTEAIEVSIDEVRRLNPAVDPAGIIGGAFCPTDGFLRPLDLLGGYLDAARRLGVRVAWDAEVVAVERRADRVVALATPRERLGVDAVVNAAGPWAAGLAALAGVHLPVLPLRRQVLPSRPQSVLPPDMPMTIFPDGFHLRVREDRILFLWPDPVAEGFDVGVDERWLDEVAMRAAARLPSTRAVPLDRAGAWAGLYEVTPDRHAILGAAPGCENLFLVNGSSGHGVMHAPALGQLVAELVRGVRPALDVSSLRPTRFAEGAAHDEGDLLG